MLWPYQGIVNDPYISLPIQTEHRSFAVQLVSSPLACFKLWKGVKPSVHAPHSIRSGSVWLSVGLVGEVSCIGSLRYEVQAATGESSLW